MDCDNFAPVDGLPISEAESARRWFPWTPKEFAGRLVAVPAWGVVGGWAIDLFLGRPTRHHHDIEITVAAHRFPEVAAALSEFEWDVVGDGCLWPYRAALEHFRQTWLRDPVSGSFLLDVFREQNDEVTWTYRLDATIAVPYAEAYVENLEGVPHLIPELVLLFKAHTVLSKDQNDFDTVLPALSEARRHRLHDWLTRTQPSHPWLESALSHCCEQTMAEIVVPAETDCVPCSAPDGSPSRPS